MKNKKKIKVPAAAFGISANDSFINKANKVSGVINDNLGDLGSLAGLILGKSDATTQGQVITQSLASVVGGMGAGANLGNSIVPGIGGLVGGAVGAVAGAIGKKGRYASMTSFTDYDEGTLSTGLRALGGANKRRRRERDRIRQNAMNNRDAVRGTAYLADEYAEDYGGMGTNTFAYGGATPTLAYVDDGELIQTPDGEVSQVPEQGKPTDSNLVSLPEGSKVLSDKLKVPGTKKTFAELGKEMMATKKTKNKDRFAENATKLNEMNNRTIHDQLFNIQEYVKQSKGIKPKIKQIQTAAYGDEIRPGLGDRIVDAIYNPNRKWGAGVQWGTGNNQWYHVPVNFNNAQPASTTRRRKATSASTNTGLIDEGKPELPFTWYGTVNPLKPKHPELLTATNSEMAGLGDALTSQADRVTTLPKSNAYSKPKPTSDKFNWGSALSGIASLTPIMSNLFTGRPETVDAVYNPYATSITNTMRRRRYDINPAIEDLNRNRATSNYNASQINTNTGANLAYRLQSAVNTDRAIASLRSQESNVNNQYLGDYANTMNSLGQQWVNATNMANEANAQNRATARNIRRTGLSQLSQWAQNRELMRNQKARDMEMWPLYQRFLQAGFTEDDLRAMMNSNRSTIKRKGGK